jgi:hypothetical protein
VSEIYANDGGTELKVSALSAPATLSTIVAANLFSDL